MIYNMLWKWNGDQQDTWTNTMAVDRVLKQQNVEAL